MEIKKELIMLIIALLLLFPIALCGQEQGEEKKDQIAMNSPPVEQALVPEGLFAVELVEALKIGKAENDAEAQKILSTIGIEPRNGWIADYPVTPDIIGEIEISVAAAAEAKRLEMGKDQALEAVEDLVARLGLNVTPGASSQSANQAAAGSQYAEREPSNHYTTNTYTASPAPEVINNYYYYVGPPVVTYYAPPRPYYYLYIWVPYRFWCFRFFFPGFFILHDFHRTIIVHKRVFVVTNHVVDVRTKTVFVIDPVRRRQFGKSAIVNRLISRPIFSSPSAKASARAIAAHSHERPKSTRVISRPGPGNAAPPQSRNRPEELIRPNRGIKTQTAMPSTISPRTTRNPARTVSSVMPREMPLKPGSSSFRPPVASNEKSINPPAINGRNSSLPAPPTVTTAPRVTQKEFAMPGNIGTRNVRNSERPRAATKYGSTLQGNSIRQGR